MHISDWPPGLPLHQESVMRDGLRDESDIVPAIHCAQNKARTLLHSFLNLPYGKKGFLFFPFYDDVASSIVMHTQELQSLIRQSCRRWQGLFQRTCRLPDVTPRPLDVAKFICALYQDMGDVFTSRLVGADRAVVSVPSPAPFDPSRLADRNIEHKAFEALLDHANIRLAQYLSGFFLHGSFATEDFVPGWSDVDTLAIISKWTLEGPERLLRLRREIYRIMGLYLLVDIHQSHGTFLVTEFDLGYFPQSYFPLILFQYCRSLLPHKELCISTRDDVEERMKTFWTDAVGYFYDCKAKRAVQRRRRLHAYSAKLFIHRLLTFPLFYLQARGIFLYKRDSFERAREYISPRLYRVIDAASTLRSNFNFKYRCRPLAKPLLLHNPVPAAWLFNKYYDLLGTSSLFVQNEQSMVNQAYELAKWAWNERVKAYNETPKFTSKP